MKPYGWTRYLIGILLIVNALPFTLDTANKRFAAGLLFLIFGLAVLFTNLPPLRDFSLFDFIRTISAAVLGGVILFWGTAPKTAVIVLSGCLVAVLFLPWRYPSKQQRAVAFASEAIDDLQLDDLITEKEAEGLSEELARRNKEKG